MGKDVSLPVRVESVEGAQCLFTNVLCFPGSQQRLNSTKFSNKLYIVIDTKWSTNISFNKKINPFGIINIGKLINGYIQSYN